MFSQPADSQLTYRQREAKERMIATGQPATVAEQMGITVRAVQYLLKRAGASYPPGNPRRKPSGRRVSYVTANAA